MLRVLICLVLAQLITADATTVTNVDFVQSIGQTNLLMRVERKVDVTYSFQLIGDNAWHQFPDMNIIIDLPFSQYVKVKYNAVVITNINTYLAMRVIVDGTQNTEMRGHMTSAAWANLVNYGQIFMSSGPHKLIVEYRTTNTAVTSPNDRTIAVFKVDYFKQATTQ